MTEFEDRYWSSRDGLKLHFRDYPAPQDAGGPALAPVLCLHGLTRNARDFDTIAPHLAETRRVICPDMRGRGDSEYAKDSASYTPVQYAEDLLELIAQEGIERFVAIGTSLGGLLSMGLATVIPEKIAGAVINDVGPALRRDGLERIKEYVGQGRSFPTWVHAAREIEKTHSGAHPDQPLDFWIGMAKRIMALTSNGRIVFDYDMKIAEPIIAADEAAVPPDLWPAFDRLAQNPLALLRGELSQLLSPTAFAEMQQRAPGAIAATVPGVGHAPTLDEPAAREAIDQLLARVA